jgi:hypothetical protein
MSRASCAGSLPDNIQFIQTNPTRTDSSSINNQTSQQQQQNHFNQFTNPTITIEKATNDIKQHQFNKRSKTSKKSFSFVINYFS